MQGRRFLANTQKEERTNARGPSLSIRLEATLDRALQHARARGHKYATVEHLLLALVDDSEAAEAMLAGNVDLDELRETVTKYLDEELTVPEFKLEEADPSPTSAFQRVVQRAILHVQSSGRSEVNGANVLVALFSERESYAVFFLGNQDLSRLDVISYLAHGITKTDQDKVREEEQEKERAEFEKYIESIDFFVSYSVKDEYIAKEIVTLLDASGYSTIAQFKNFKTGSNFVREMQKGLERSAKLIALYSPAYEASDHCQAEWAAAYAADPRSAKRRIIPFLIEPTTLNPLARQIVYKNLVGLDAPARARAVLDAVQHTPAPPQKSQIIREVARMASPDVRENSGRLDAIPNADFDAPLENSKTSSVERTLIALAAAVHEALPHNTSPLIKVCLKRYEQHLVNHGSQPILGVLTSFAAAIGKEIGSPDCVLSEGLSALLQDFLGEHDRLLGFFPKNAEREQFLSNTEVDESPTGSRAIVNSVSEASAALAKVAEEGLTTPAFDEALRNQLEMANELASRPPSANVEQGSVSSRGRFVLSTLGFYERVVEVLSKSAGLVESPAVRNALKVVKSALLELWALIR